MKKPLIRLMMRPFIKKYLWVLISGCLSLFIFTIGYAQTRNKLELSKPDLSKYPDISTFFRVFDQDGKFINNLQPSNLRIQENDQIVAADRLELLEPGVRFIVAINEGPTLANRFAAISRIDKVKTELTKWAQAQILTTMDDFNLVSNTGTQVAKLTKPEDWIKAIAAYQPEMREAQPGLASLSSAVDLATSASETTQKTSAILYFTPLPTTDQITGLKDIIKRAVQGNVRLFIWLAGPSTFAASPEAELLRQGAEQTHGDFFLFSGSEELPALSGYLNPLRYIYKLNYTSQIKNSGDFSLALKVTRNETVLESEPVTFSLKVLPPNPIFLSPPAMIHRTWTETRKRSDSVLSPDTAAIKIMIEFPDGMKRGLEYSRLFIDNKLVAENTSEPFDTFEWNINKFETSGTHVMSVTIQDAAGFIAKTVDLPVEIAVEVKHLTWYEKLFSSLAPQNLVLIFVVAATGIFLVLTASKTLKKSLVTKQVKSHRLEDPVTQPVMIENEVLTPKAKSEAISEWPHIPGVGLAPARLVLQRTESSASDLLPEIPLSNQELTIGKDPNKAKVLINDALVSSLHAKISKEDLDQFKIFDAGSGSGTWLNYAPVSIYGARLKHGDLIQFGKVAYRFEIYGPQPKQMRVLPYQEEE